QRIRHFLEYDMQSNVSHPAGGIARKRAFSLVELLVVIAIVATLLALLLPALRTARENARRVMCGVNMQQCASALFAYAADHRGSVLSNHSHAGAPPTKYYDNDP